VQDPTETAKRTALQFVHSSDIPPEHKAVILEALSESLRNHLSVGATTEAERTWNPDEEAGVRSFLDNKPARGWQHADELVMALAARLHRTPNDVRRKAVELGLGVSVDYRLARLAAQDTQS
jgi:hypothetical protein